ncbi:hypothetical protein [Pseudomonas typographi]|uniref:Aminoglycoside phosphotransferase domain-containing protein n=1 Tax=Pseudomonas typographi TaxID=2715964 RepID=A0ABR7Z3M1_9PSED|nr:hypothetical protein [Pseudomonas typographi]MBD1599886.1 hypothetical protein [Pseudomonas typographi]
MREPSEPLAAQARALAKQGDWGGARTKLLELVTEVIGTQAIDLKINRDQYSLNSLNGVATLVDGRHFFFKYHNEEGEDKTIEEYYNAELLRAAGYRVDVPVYACGEPGRQILFYGLREDLRLADVCRNIEEAAGWQHMERVVRAQACYDKEALDIALRTLKVGNPAAVVKEPVHQLFHHRLATPELRDGLGGRVYRNYVGQRFTFPGAEVSWDVLKALKWVINGLEYNRTLEELFLEAGDVLAPAKLAGHGVVTAHGDAHNANVWFEDTQGEARLVSFDPAFAGRHIPALLAEIKATFHNIFAHPLWLYEPARVAERYKVYTRIEGGRIHVDFDWDLSPLREAFLASKAREYWKPLIAELKARNLLPLNWQRVMRLALFCCPTLVLDLRAGGNGGHTPDSSALGLAIAISAGSEPVAGADQFSRLFSAIA